MSLSPLDLLPPQEEARLFTLNEYDIFHSLHEPVFDEVVLLATVVFKLPISLIGLVGAEQVRYQAEQGLSGFTGQARQEAICALAIRRNQAVVFTDLTRPAQQAQLTAAAYSHAQQKHLRFYAGAPLRMPNQQPIGTLCVIDRRPRAFTEAAVFVLEQLAHLVERIIVVRHLCLASSWLGGDSWKAVQAYVVLKVQELAALARQANQAAGCDNATLAPTMLRQVLSQLNVIGSVLAEPLPGFA